MTSLEIRFVRYTECRGSKYRPSPLAKPLPWGLKVVLAVLGGARVATAV